MHVAYVSHIYIYIYRITEACEIIWVSKLYGKRLLAAGPQDGARPHGGTECLQEACRRENIPALGQSLSLFLTLQHDANELHGALVLATVVFHEETDE